jgi:hypothetical protein
VAAPPVRFGATAQMLDVDVTVLVGVVKLDARVTAT